MTILLNWRVCAHQTQKNDEHICIDYWIGCFVFSCGGFWTFERMYDY